MSREIKFRCWNNCSREYIPENELMNNFAEYLREEHLYIEQYTGLKDKNGEEIYEGDIMEFGIAGAENRGVVGYEEDFGSYETYTSKGYIIASLFTCRGKIIGNIHENPELLGGEE